MYVISQLADVDGNGTLSLAEVGLAVWWRRGRSKEQRKSRQKKEGRKRIPSGVVA